MLLHRLCPLCLLCTGMLQHQQNMLQDYIRTGTYHAAIVENPADFEGKAVMDVGCGSGILSLFAAQAGARVVYAVEASDMAHYARQLAAANPGGWLGWEAPVGELMRYRKPKFGGSAQCM